MDKRKLAREKEHMTRPPRLEGVVKNARMLSGKKPKGKMHAPLKGVLSHADDAPRRATVPKRNPGAAPGRTNLPE